MRHDERLSPAEIAGWGGLGLLTGLVLGIALSAWAGDVNRARIGRATKRLRTSGPVRRVSPGAAARDARGTLSATPALRGLPIEVRAVAPGVVELRGWVASRTQRALADGLREAEFVGRLAEELSVPLAKVEVIQGDTALTPDQGATWGSLSIQAGGVHGASHGRRNAFLIGVAKGQTRPRPDMPDCGLDPKLLGRRRVHDSSPGSV